MALVLEQHITQSDEIRSGKPHIAGTRITISDIVTWHFRMGISLEEIAAKYDLALAAVYAAVSYYYDHKTDIDNQIESSLTTYHTAKNKSPSLLKEKLSNANRD